MDALAIEALSKIAHYYPNPIWDHDDWIKNLMFFSTDWNCSFLIT